MDWLPGRETPPTRRETSYIVDEILRHARIGAIVLALIAVGVALSLAEEQWPAVREHEWWDRTVWLVGAIEYFAILGFGLGIISVVFLAAIDEALGLVMSIRQRFR